MALTLLRGVHRASSHLLAAQLRDLRYVSIIRYKQTSSSGPINKYSKTVLLPHTDFVLNMKPSERKQQDRSILKRKRHVEVYKYQFERADNSQTFTLLDGPPYANGRPHIGHAVNKIAKDIINRWHLLQGRRVTYQPGWDCHGLPIEHQILSRYTKEGTKSPPALEVRRQCRQFAQDWVEVQSSTFQSWGVMGDWSEPYLTMSDDYVRRQMRLFHRLYKSSINEKSVLFRRYMPVHWSPSSNTALAESELEYVDSHVSTAIHLTFRLTPDSANRLLSRLGRQLAEQIEAVDLLVWTTTPWTLPANKALTVGPSLSYSLLTVGDVNSSRTTVIVGSELYRTQREKFDNILGQSVELAEFSADLLTDLHYSALSGDERLPIVYGTHVTSDCGTGIVHTAPAHGQDDFVVGLSHNLDTTCHVNESGCFEFPRDANPKLRDTLQGLYVLDRGTTAKLLSLYMNNLVHADHDYIHSYPYDWRTKQPIIMRASRQWFFDTTTVKDLAINAVKSDRVHLNSAAMKNALLSTLEKRPYWCISRQRVWGTPIPVLYRKSDPDCVIIDDDLIEKYCERVTNGEGADFWWKADSVADLVRGTKYEAEVDDLVKSDDILDVWMDSGLSWHTANPTRPVDMVIEGVDQINAWFYSSLMTSCALEPDRPFSSRIIVHGFTLDANMCKMSKSAGNVICPGTLMGEGRGVDVLRHWVASHFADGGNHMHVSDVIINLSKSEMRRLRTLVKYILGNLGSFMPARKKYAQMGQELLPLDRYILSRLAKLRSETDEAYEAANLQRVVSKVNEFVASTLSGFYVMRVKNRLYCDAIDSTERKSALTAMYYILLELTAIVAPIAPVLAVEIDLQMTSQIQRKHETFRLLHRMPALLGDLSQPIEQLMPVIEALNSSQIAVPVCLRHRMHIVDLGNDGQLSTHLGQLSKTDLVELFGFPVVTFGRDADFDEPISRPNDLAPVCEANFRLVFVPLPPHQTTCPRCRLYCVSEPADGDLCSRCSAVLLDRQDDADSIDKCPNESASLSVK